MQAQGIELTTIATPPKNAEQGAAKHSKGTRGNVLARTNEEWLEHFSNFPLNPELPSNCRVFKMTGEMHTVYHILNKKSH